jgi:hypothetical protein
VSASSQRLSRDARRPRRSSSVVRSRRIRQTFVSNRAFVCSSSASFVASRRVVRFVARARTTHFPAHVSRHTAHRDIAPRRDLPSRSPGHPSIHPSVRARREETCTWIRRVARAGVARSTAPRFNSRVVDIFFFKRDVDGGDATIAADASRARTRVDATAIDRARRKNRDDVAVARESNRRAARHIATMPMMTCPTTTTRPTTTRASARRATRANARRATTTTTTRAVARDDDDAREERSTRRAIVMMTATMLATAATTRDDALAYGTGGWKDCEPICDSLKNGRAEQLAMQEEMMRSMGRDASASEGEGESKRERERRAERERARGGK